MSSHFRRATFPAREGGDAENLGRYASVNTAGSGVRLRVLDANADRSVYTVQVDKK
jgi:hypothetical protein